jgi:pimeloyl-ACP methyl ester carboxylesterase
MTITPLNDTTVGYDDVGSGSDAILLVHGHPFNRSMWQPQLSAIAAGGWRAIAPDLRGYGDTTVVPGKTTFDVFAADLAALLDHLGLDRVVLGGLSMGGQIVMEFARQYPTRLRGIVLAATFCEPESEDGKRWRYSMADRLVKEGMHPYANEVLAKMLAARSITDFPDVAAHVMTMMCGTNPEGAAAALRGRAERPDYQPTLAALTVPALVIVGSEDAYTTRVQAERMRDLPSDAELVWLDGIGHMPNLERPEAFNAEVIRFLHKLSA